jgi:hypothetical protein
MTPTTMMTPPPTGVRRQPGGDCSRSPPPTRRSGGDGRQRRRTAGKHHSLVQRRKTASSSRVVAAFAMNDEEEEVDDGIGGGASTSGRSWEDSFESSSSPTTRGRRQGRSADEGRFDGDAFYDAGSTTRGRRAMNGRSRSSRDRPSSSSSSSSRARPAVSPLTRRDYERAIPIGATGEQYGYFWGDGDTAFQRVGLSLLTTVLTANALPIVAVPASTFFLWAPVALAARRNSRARRSKYAGLWRAKVLEVAPVDTRGGSRLDWMLDMLVGDDSGARVSLKVPLRAEYADINEGDNVELVVTSDDPDFYTFQAIREAYVPEINVWVGEYPFLDRRAMIAISDRFARESR